MVIAPTLPIQFTHNKIVALFRYKTPKKYHIKYRETFSNIVCSIDSWRVFPNDEKTFLKKVHIKNEKPQMRFSLSLLFNIKM